jgi:hypothetical protein
MLTTLIAFSFVFGLDEMWQIWNGDMTEHDIFLFKDLTLPMQWLMKDLGTILSRFLLAIVIYRLTRIHKPLRVLATVYLVHAGVGVLLFFLCYNTWSYTLVYAFLIPLGALVWLGKLLLPSKGLKVQGSDTTKLNSSTKAKYKYFGTEASNSDRADLRRISFIDKSMIKQ